MTISIVPEPGQLGTFDHFVEDFCTHHIPSSLRFPVGGFVATWWCID